MKIKYWFIFFTILFFVSVLFIFKSKKENTEFRAVYFSYIEFSEFITDKSDEEQKENIREVLDNIKDMNFNRIIVHVRPFSDSIYKSDYYPVSKYVLNDKGSYPDYDVLEYFVSETHKRDIKFDAWINPYRISNLSTTDSRIYTEYSKDGSAKVTENGIYLNPASIKTQELIINGIKEIIENYDVDGIHFDDYFYPDKEIDLELYELYVKNGGTNSLTDYRYNNVKKLIKDTYSVIKNKNGSILFGIAPQGNIDNCYEDSFLDVKEILKNNGYIDYIMPQIYFGFNNKSRPFIDTVNDWINMIENKNIKFIPALAFYKIGTYDKYAGEGNNEWIENNDVISREITYLKGLDKYNGFSIFSYNYMFNDKYKKEHTNNEMDLIRKELTK